MTLQGIDEFEYRFRNLALDPVALKSAGGEWIPSIEQVFWLWCHDCIEREMRRISRYPSDARNHFGHLLVNILPLLALTLKIVARDCEVPVKWRFPLERLEIMLDCEDIVLDRH